MPTVEELGRRVKEKYPGAYDDLDDIEVGRRAKEKYPEAYADFQDMPAEAVSVVPQSTLDRVLTSAGKIMGAVPGTKYFSRTGSFPASMVVEQAEDIFQRSGTVGPTVGEAAGQSLGMMTGPAAPVAKPVLGAVGAAGGLAVERYLRGEVPPTTGELLMEAGLTLVPEAAESAMRSGIGRRIGQRIIRRTAEKRLPVVQSTRAGQVLRHAEAFKRAEGSGARIFESPSEEAVKQLFDDVRASGAQVPTDLPRSFLGQLDDTEAKRLLRELRRADATLNNRYRSIGIDKTSDMAMQFEDIMTGGDPVLDIGDMQDLRSALRERIQSISNPEMIDLLEDTKDIVDTAIDSAIGSAPTELRQARNAYRRYKAAEEFETLLLQKSSLPTGRGNVRTLRLGSLRQELKQNKSRSAQNLNQILDSVPGARERLDGTLNNLETLYKQIELTGGGDVTGVTRQPFIAAMFNGLSEIMLNDVGLQMFEEAVIAEKGKISANTIALIVGVVRRAVQGALLPAPALEPLQEPGLQETRRAVAPPRQL